jgi:cellulose synthase/poly-beta-1,6-N-acetylglucosamine synthase-like glycosyltransferase
MELLFWLSLIGIFYAYLGYPIILFVIGKIKKKSENVNYQVNYYPSLSIIMPVHNEEKVIESKIKNIFSIDYPENRFELIIVSDGSTDRTKEIILDNPHHNIKFYELPARRGKAAALNLGLEKSSGEIIVFTDASIMLDKEALKNIVKKFQDGRIGCVSGEDYIHESGGEGLYGRYELFLRNLESKVHSIVGASGSFYAQRRELCNDFKEGMAPDFLSVLATVEKGYRAITEPSAFGIMTSLKSSSDEFNRKVRTLVRGMSAIFYKKSLLNPFRYGIFSFELLSHKIMRWLVPFFLISLLLSNLFLLDSSIYLLAFITQVIFYLLAVSSMSKIINIHEKIYVKVPLYFTAVNAAILYAWVKYLSGTKQEIWNPTKRQT